MRSLLYNTARNLQHRERHQVHEENRPAETVKRALDDGAHAAGDGPADTVHGGKRRKDDAPEKKRRSNPLLVMDAELDLELAAVHEKRAMLKAMNEAAAATMSRAGEVEVLTTPSTDSEAKDSHESASADGEDMIELAAAADECCSDNPDDDDERKKKDADGEDDEHKKKDADGEVKKKAADDDFTKKVAVDDRKKKDADDDRKSKDADDDRNKKAADDELNKKAEHERKKKAADDERKKTAGFASKKAEKEESCNVEAAKGDKTPEVTASHPVKDNGGEKKQDDDFNASTGKLSRTKALTKRANAYERAMTLIDAGITLEEFKKDLQAMVYQSTLRRQRKARDQAEKLMKVLSETDEADEWPDIVEGYKKDLEKLSANP